MRLSPCSRPSGPLERAPLTALWASIADGAAPVPATGATAVAAPPVAPACDAWWTADERYVVRVAAGLEDVWYVGELDGAGMGSASDLAAALAAPARPSDEGAPSRSRSVLVGRRRGPRAVPGAMRLHVRRPPRS